LSVPNDGLRFFPRPDLEVALATKYIYNQINEDYLVIYFQTGSEKVPINHIYLESGDKVLSNYTFSR
jgi:hypothetical protein